MAILFASNEDTGFTTASGGAVGVNTTPVRWRTGYARGGINVTANLSATDPMGVRLVSPAFASDGLLWIHGQFFEAGGGNNANVQGLLVRSPDGVSRIIVRQTGTYGQLKVSTRNSAGTITDLATATGNFTATTVTQFDLRIDYSAAGGVQMWLGGSQVINYAGDPRTDSATQLNQFEFAGLGNSFTYWSEVIAADEDTRNMGVVTLQPVAAGNTQAWTPNTVANINETTLSDVTFVTDSTGAALSQWTTPTSIPGGNNYVFAIVQEARLRGATAAVDWSLRTGGVDSLAGSAVSPTASFVNYRNRIWATKPGGGSWAPADITGGGLNLGIKSVGAAVATDASKINAYAVVSTTPPPVTSGIYGSRLFDLTYGRSRTSIDVRTYAVIMGRSFTAIMGRSWPGV